MIGRRDTLQCGSLRQAVPVVRQAHQPLVEGKRPSFKQPVGKQEAQSSSFAY